MAIRATARFDRLPSPQRIPTLPLGTVRQPPVFAVTSMAQRAATRRQHSARSREANRLYGARGCRYELRRSYFAESDAHQVAFSTALVSLDLSVVLATLRRAPFAAFPFVVWNVLS